MNREEIEAVIVHWGLKPGTSIVFVKFIHEGTRVLYGVFHLKGDILEIQNHETKRCIEISSGKVLEFEAVSHTWIASLLTYFKGESTAVIATPYPHK